MALAGLVVILGIAYSILIGIGYWGLYYWDWTAGTYILGEVFLGLLLVVFFGAVLYHLARKG